ncbi:MAG: hypothetical protein HFJ72_08340 [Adlercreutzia sp.]|nr:hypothetical protein [Adlercreutzia sp.]
MPCNPYARGEAGRGHGYEPGLAWEKLTADYLRIPVTEVGDLDMVFYLEARRDAYIARLSETPEGEEYLSEAWRLTRTEPDLAASRELFGQRGV